MLALLLFLSNVTMTFAFVPYSPSFVSRHIGLDLIDLEEYSGTALNMAPSNGTYPSKSTKVVASDVKLFLKIEDGEDATEDTLRNKNDSKEFQHEEAVNTASLNDQSFAQDLEDQME